MTQNAGVHPLQIAEEHWNAGRTEQAEAICRQVLAIQPNHPVALRLLGMSLYSRGNTREALALLQRAVDVNPNDFESWQRLGELQLMEQATLDAAPTWERAVALAPDNAYARSLLGWTLHQQDKFDEAEEQHRIALRLDPNSSLALMNMADLLHDRGDRDKAVESARAALRAEPGFPRALSRLALTLGAKLPPEDQEFIEKRLAAGDLPDFERCRLLFAMASVYDARGDFARAASYARQANALNIEQLERRGSLTPAANHIALIDWTIESFGPEFFKRVAGSGDPTRRLVFVFGLPRSGTSLVEQILSSHSQTHGAGELPISLELFASVPSVVGCVDQPLECFKHVDSKAIATLTNWYLDRLKCIDRPDRARLIDKTLHNYLRLGLLAVMFPNATFIHCRRDLRDIAVSCWMTNLINLYWTSDIPGLAVRIQQYVRIMDHWRAVLPVKIHEVEYESVVADLEGNARKMIDWCGLEWEEQCLAFHRTKRSVRTASVTQVRKPIYNRSVARWKNYEKELADLFSLLPPQP